MLRKLWKLLDDIAPSLTDAIVHHLGTVWDFLGFFGVPVAITLGLIIIGGALYLHDRSFQRQLATRRADAEADVAREPTLLIVPRLKGVKRVFKPRNRTMVIRMDLDGMFIQRRKTSTEIAWRDVTQWTRLTRAHWTLETSDRSVEIVLRADHGFTEDELRRIENRLAYHTASVPEPAFDWKETVAQWRSKLRGWRRRMPIAQPTEVTEAAEPLRTIGENSP